MGELIVLTDEAEIAKKDAELEQVGYRWGQPIPLWEGEVWDDGDNVPMVEEPCPNCKKLTDRTFNMTMNRINGIIWLLHHCMACKAVWFESESREDEPWFIDEDGDGDTEELNVV